MNKSELSTGANVLSVNPIALTLYLCFCHEPFDKLFFSFTGLNNKYPFSYNSQETPSSPCATIEPSGCQFLFTIPISESAYTTFWAVVKAAPKEQVTALTIATDFKLFFKAFFLDFVRLSMN